jgi:serine/threonine-protein kinase HipA
MNRELYVLIEQNRIGCLFENAGIWSFEYESDWLIQGYPLAPGLPLQSERIVDSGSARPVQWFFDNLLPEDMARTRLIASLEKGEWDAWRLLEKFGSESAGALTLLKPGEHLAEPGLLPLSNEQLQARIEAMPRIPLGTSSPKKMSLAGAQEKLPVVMDADGNLFEPIGSQISTHILKPDALSEHYPASAINEWYCARIAQELGLPVPPVTLRYVPSCIYLIERFDRIKNGDKLLRRHTLDAAQLLSLSAGSKYTLSGAKALSDVIALCRAKAATRVALFRWTVFNVLIGNGDAHLKNLSLFTGKDGYALAPHYDLVSTAAWARPELVNHGPKWPNIELSFSIGNARTFEEIRCEHLFQFAEEINLPRISASRELTRLVRNIEFAADKVIAEFECLAVPDVARAGQLRMLRAIRYLPISNMRQQLACSSIIVDE